MTTFIAFSPQLFERLAFLRCQAGVGDAKIAKPSKSGSFDTRLSNLFA